MPQTLSPGLPAGSQELHQPPALETMGPGITTLTPAQWRPAVQTLVHAFAEDPVAAYLFPDPVKRAAGMAHIFRIELRYGEKYGRVDMTQTAGAVAVWVRPEYTAPSWVRMVMAGVLASPFTVGWSATRRMLAFEHFISDCRWRTLGGPHWFLLCIGVRPDQQGQGLGAALIRQGLQRIEAGGVPCYLETANERNLPFYQKNGFRVVGPKQVPDAGPGVWSLVAGTDH